MIKFPIVFLFFRVPFCFFLFFFIVRAFSSSHYDYGGLRAIELFFRFLCQHFGWSVFWFPFTLLFFSKKNKFLIKALFFLLIPLGFSNLAGILWFGSREQLLNYFGFFAIFSQELFTNLFLQILLLFFYGYALYLLISRHQLHLFWKVFYFYLFSLFTKTKVWKKKLLFRQKIIDKKLFKTYTNNILVMCSKFLRLQSSSKKVPKAIDIKRIPSKNEESLQNDSLDSSLSELLSVFRSLNNQNK